MADKYTPERATSGKERLRTWWKKVENNIVKIFGAVNKHIDGTADRHTADMIDYSDTETVKAKLDKAAILGEQRGSSIILHDENYESLEESGGQSGGYRAIFGNNEIRLTNYDSSNLDEYKFIVSLREATYSSSSFEPRYFEVETFRNYESHKLTEKANSSAVSKHIDGTADRHTADMIDYSDTETVKAKLDSTDTKLDTKVDKIEGKSLIDENVANKFSEETTIPNGVKLDGNLLINNTVAATGEVAIREYSQGLNGYTFTHKLSEKANAADVGTLSDLTTTDKSSIVAAINEVKSSGGGDVLDNLTYDSTNDIINSSANLLLENSASVAAYNGTFRGDITIGQLGANKWAYRISPITGFSTSVDVTCTSGNKVHSLANKADSNDVLTKTNTAAFTPTADYQPATKKYVDDAIKTAIEKYNTEAMALLGEDQL